jgi:hypothetical protein
MPTLLRGWHCCKQKLKSLISVKEALPCPIEYSKFTTVTTGFKAYQPILDLAERS